MDPTNQEKNDPGSGAPHGPDKPRHANGTPGDGDRWLRLVVENSSDLISLINPDNTFRYISPSVRGMLGYKPEELEGTLVSDLLHPEDFERFGKKIVEQIQGGISPSNPIQGRYRHKDGSWRHLETTFNVMIDDPSVRGVVCTTRDITERKEAEERLEETEGRYRTLVEQTPAVIYINPSDGSNLTLYVSPQIEVMLGYTPEEWMATDLWAERIHSDDVQWVLAANDRSRKSGEPFAEEYRLLAKDGSVVWVRDEAALWRDEADETLFWQGVIMNVTERKETEQRLHFQAQLLGAVGEAVIGLDMEGKVAYWNQAAETLYGWAAEEVMGRNLREMVVPEGLRGQAEEIAVQVREEGSWSGEFVVRRRDGTLFPVEATNTPIFGEDGEQVGVVGVLRDATDRKRAEEALRESGERYRAVIEQTTEGIYLGAADTRRVLESNAAFQRMLGYSAQELRGMHIYDFVAHDRDNIDSVFRGVLDRGHAFIRERKYRRKDGSVVDVEASATVISYHDREVVCTVVRDVTERKEAEERLQHQAFHDLLTDLPNRQLLLDRLGRALARTERRRDSRVAVLFMDLDGFKVVNDSLGHEAGDRLLVEVAERLKGCLRPEDTLARFGGDEFIVLLEEVEGADDAFRVAERITEEFRGPFALDERELTLRFSIGVALGEADTKSPEELLRDADTAMYRAKAETADYRVFDPEMHEQALGRLELESYLRHALEREEFTVYYQPKFRLGQTDRIEGVEALLRWEHPQRGFTLPGEFLPLAEETGLIIPIGGWVMKEACRQAKEWQERHPSEPPLAMCVNLSAGQVRHPGLLQEVRSALQESGLDPGSLILELTEGTLLKDTQAIGNVFKELKALGVRLAIDDFGKEYSSLSYLNRLPVDALKIDRLFLESFGEDPSNTIIVEGVVSLAHSLGLEVIGEGVESAEQLELLREMGCDCVQGYHLARPLPSEEVEQLLVNRTTS